MRPIDKWAVVFAGAVLAFLLAVVLWPQPAAAAKCAARAAIVKQLGKQFAERRRAVGLINKNLLMEIYVSRKKGTWTVLLTSPRGTACIVAAGRMWQEVPVLDGPAT